MILNITKYPIIAPILFEVLVCCLSAADVADKLVDAEALLAMPEMLMVR